MMRVDKSEWLARQRAEVARLEEVRALGAVPAACGPEIPVAPARGALCTFRPIELVPGSLGTARDTGHWARGEDARRKGARIEDVFARMVDEARTRHAAQGGEGAFTPPLSPAQVQIGRDYRDMVERHGAGGLRCVSLEASRGGGAGGEFIDAYVAEGIRIDILRRRIGPGVALAMRRIRPSRRGARARGIITDRALVDAVCLGNSPLGVVLDDYGWSAYGNSREALRRALAAALDRMMGYDRRHPQNGA